MIYQTMHAVSTLAQLLEETRLRLLDEDFACVGECAAALLAMRCSVAAAEWTGLVRDVIRPHAVMPLLLEDPMTYRSFAKPRGYSGDAVLLDLIYQHAGAGIPLAEATARGRSIYEQTVRSPGPQSVRTRREILAKELDRAAFDYNGCAALSIACGHLREAEWSEAVRGKAFRRLVGLDQDGASLAVAEEALGQFGFEPRNLTVKTLVAGHAEWEQQFDFVYSAGLYDYLSSRFAQRLTARLFDFLKPGGRLLLANFLPGIADGGYLEGVMDWWLLYRAAEEIRDFAKECPADQVAAMRFFQDPGNHIGYLEIYRG